jgi:hypothetical protein
MLKFPLSVYQTQVCLLVACLPGILQHALQPVSCHHTTTEHTEWPAAAKFTANAIIPPHSEVLRGRYRASIKYGWNSLWICDLVRYRTVYFTEIHINHNYKYVGILTCPAVFRESCSPHPHTPLYHGMPPSSYAPNHTRQYLWKYVLFTWRSYTKRSKRYRTLIHGFVIWPVSSIEIPWWSLFCPSLPCPLLLPYLTTYGTW